LKGGVKNDTQNRELNQPRTSRGVCWSGTRSVPGAIATG